MLNKSALSLAALLLAGTAHANAAFEGEDHTYAALLVSSDTNDVKLAAKALARHQTRNAAVFDIAAEVLSQACHSHRAVDEDTQSWLAVALGKSQQNRYEPVLNFCFKHAVPKVQMRARSALSDLVQAGPAYPEGSVDFAAISAQLAESVKRDAAHRTANAFDTLTYRESLADVYKAMGLPDRVQLSSMRLLAVYDNAGAVAFSLPNGDDTRWIASSITGTPLAKGEKHVSQVRNWLGNTDPFVVESLARDLIQQAEHDRNALDPVAARIAQGRALADPDMADSLAWLCKSLGQSHDGRYKQLLKDIGRNATTSGMRKHCSNAANELPDGDAQPFRPETYVVAAPPAPKLPEVPVNVPGVNEPVQVVPVAGASTTTTATAAPNTTTTPAAAAPAPSAQPAQSTPNK